ncbi:uncharacterized protein [Nicotiana tomentosiformis]|uniref:uncharacterized protein n=1 Tax=Nicotiana tomentosiformis TaxID=4098 RepID=UPI00388CD13A
MVCKNGGIPKKGSSSRTKGYDCCHKCKKPGHFIKDCPLQKKDHYKHNKDKTAKRNLVPKRKFKRKNAADNIVKQALVSDFSIESEGDDEQGDTSMMAIESEAAEYDSMFALMAKSDEDEDDDDDNIKFLDVQRNLKFYSQKKLVYLANILIDIYHNLINDKNILTEELGEIEHERDDLLVVVVDLKETIEYLKNEKDVLTEKIEKEKHERDDLLVIIVDLKETLEELKWDNIAVNISVENCMNYSKGKEVACEAHLKVENELKKGAVKWNSQRWYMDSSCSKHMTRSIDDFLSLKALQCGSVSFGNAKKGYILGLEKIKKTLNHSIENVYYVNGLKYILLSVSQICDKGNKVEFLSKSCTITNIITSKVMMVAKRFKNIYVNDFESLNSRDLTCLSVVDDDVELWDKRLGHASFFLLNNLVKKDLVRVLPKSKFKDHKVCDACVKRKQVRSSFKPKKEVSTSRPLDILHTDQCRSMRMPNKGGKKYIFVIVDDYSRFTWTLFLKTKDETFPVFAAFVK